MNDDAQSIDVQLITAVEEGNVDEVKKLLKKGANVHVNEDYCIYRAALYNETEIAKLLIRNGANILSQNNAPINASISFENLELLETMINETKITDELLDELIAYAVVSDKVRSFRRLLNCRVLSNELQNRLIDIVVSSQNLNMAIELVSVSDSPLETAMRIVELGDKYRADRRFMAPMLHFLSGYPDS